MTAVAARRRMLSSACSRARYGALRMDNTPRVQRLRELIAQLESLPASPDRDRLLNEFRSRAVDVDTGVTPRAVLPMREPGDALIVKSRPREGSRGVPRAAPPAPALTVDQPRPAPVANPDATLDEPFWASERLSLDDSEPAAPVGSRGDRIVPPWTLGLRG